MKATQHRSAALLSMIQNVTNLDVLLLSKEGLLREEFGRQNTPEAFFFSVDELRLIRERLCYGENLRCLEALTGAGLHYLAFRYEPATRDEGLLLVGPFLVMPIASDLVDRAMLRHQLPFGERLTIENFFDSLPHVGKSYAENLGMTLRALLRDPLEPLETIEEQPSAPVERERAVADLAMIDQNRITDFFLLEKMLRSAVKQGDASLFNELSSDGNYFNYFRFRVTRDTLRAAKNMNISYNAMLRFAALDGGANPIQVHLLTWRYVRMAQAARSVEELMKIQNAMADDFIALVRNRRLEGYSVRLREALEYVDLHLAVGVTLRDCAAYTRMSPSNLAYYFRKEMGTTFQDYVRERRLEEARTLLENAALSIKQITALIGFRDPSRFIKAFRDREGTTPKQYRKRLSLKNL